MDGLASVTPGWRSGLPYSAQSQIVSVADGAGVGVTAQQVIVAKTIPPGTRVYIDSISLRVVDNAAYDQVRFSLRHNGAKLIPWDNISGEQISGDYVVPVGQDFDPGLIEIAATSIAGTSEAGAAGALNGIRVICRFRGSLLNPSTDRSFT